MALPGVDFSESAKPLAQAFALNEVSRFRLHVALSDVHKHLLAGDLEGAKLRAEVALMEERDGD